MKNLTNLRKSVLTVLAVLISGIAFSQFTRQQAISLVMNNIVGADSLSINVFAALDSRSQQQSVVLFDNRTVSCAYSNNWVFFIDDNRNAFWCHACRYVFVSGQTGNYTIVNQDMFPVDLETTYQLITTIPPSGQIPVPDYTGSGVTLDAPNDHLFAVLVGGTQQSGFWTNISMIYNTLLEKGYKKENIFVHFSNADGSYGNGLYDDDLDGDLILDDIDYVASLASLQTTFDNLSGVSTSNPEIPKLQHGDQLLVHFDSHGYSYNSFNMGAKLLLEGNNFEYLFDYQLADWMEPIDCAQMLITMQQCFSGGFIGELTDYITYPGTLCKNRLVITAAGFEPSYMEAHITGGTSIIEGGIYGEFDFYFYSALRGVYPDTEIPIEPWNTAGCYPIGSYPFYNFPTLVNHPLDYDPDEVLGNDDGIVQVGEGFLYMDDFDTWSSNGYYMPFPPYSYVEHPQYVKTGLFIEDLFTLTGLTGEVGNNQTVTGNFLIGGNITIKSTADVNITNASEFYFQDANSRIYIRGELNIGEDVLLKGQGDNLLSLVRTETDGTITIGSGTEFNHMRLELTSYPLQDYLLMDDLAFINSDINGQVESIDVLNTDFTNSWLQIANCDDFYMDDCIFNFSNLTVSGNSFSTTLSMARIYDCEFTNLNTISTAVTIEQMPKYSFSGNRISGYNLGLNVFYSGEGNMAEISNNEIFNNTENGIVIYNSHAYMRLNNIHNNAEDGISLLNSSYVRLTGNQGAKYVSETQRFRDNGMYEVFSDMYSFPTEFKWNALIDEDNEVDGYELVYRIPDIMGIPIKDVRYNYWGSEANFHPEFDLFPVGGYSYLPKFKLVDDEDASSSDELLFNSAENEFELGNYSAAKSGFQQVIEQYPDSKFANASIKQLFSVEAFADNDFTALKQYFMTNNIILNSEELENLADFLANKCDIKLENWQTAIDWFENRIISAESFEDSLYSVIDLGNTYLLMEQSGFKSAYIGNLTEHIPASLEQYSTKRDYLISLLPQVKPSNQLKLNLAGLKTGELLQNVPNPFNGSTQIWFKLTEESIVSVTIYDYTGKEVSVINPGSLKTGNHSVEFNSDNLSAGIYFYSLKVNGIKTDTKKMTLMK